MLVLVVHAKAAKNSNGEYVGVLYSDRTCGLEQIPFPFRSLEA